MAKIIKSVIKSRNQRIISSAGLRLFSSEVSDVPDFCYMLCAKGVLVYPGGKFQQLDDFFAKNPFFSPIPSSGLYGSVSQKWPHILEDPVRQFISSGSLAPYVANKNQVEFANLFFKGNVGVHQDSGLVCFRKLGPFKSISTQSSKGYNDYSTFLKELICERYGSTFLSQIPLDLVWYFRDLDKGVVEEKIIIDHPTTFTNHVYAEVFCDAFWILVKDMKLTDPLKAMRILESIGREEPNCLQEVINNGLLPQFLPFPLQRLYPALKFPFAALHPRSINHEQEDGEIVVHVTRHGYVHCRDLIPLSVVQKNFPSGTTYTRLDVLKLARASFPNAGRAMVKAFDDENILHLLKIRERKPLPSLSLADPMPTVIPLATLFDCGVC